MNQYMARRISQNNMIRATIPYNVLCVYYFKISSKTQNYKRFKGN